MDGTEKTTNVDTDANDPPGSPDSGGDDGPPATVTRLRPRLETRLESESVRVAQLIHERDEARNALELLQYDHERLLADIETANALARIETASDTDQDDAAYVARIEAENVDLQERLDQAWAERDEYEHRLNRVAAGRPDDGTEPGPNRFGAVAMTMAQIEAMRPPPALVDGWLYQDTIAMLYARPGLGKSFIAQDLSLAVAYGLPWQDREVAQGNVIYVAAEGASGIGKRTAAWRTFYGREHTESEVTFIPRPVNLFDRWDVNEFIEFATWPGYERPALIVLDTFARCTVGAEENSARDMGIVMDNLTRLKAATGACILVVHHTGKDGTVRGSSAIAGALDTALELSGDPGDLRLKNPKQKDAVEMKPLGLRLMPVPGTSSVVVVGTRGAGPQPGEPLPDAHQALLDVLHEIDSVDGVTSTAWREACDGIDKATFARRVNVLREQGLVVNVGTDKRVRYRAAART